MARARARVLLAELAKRNAFPQAVAGYCRDLFDEQRKVIADDARFVAVHAGRRSGKTRLGRTRAIMAAAEHPGAFIPIYERTSTCTAARVMWQELKRDSKTYNLGLKFRETPAYVAECPNGAKIGIVGVDKQDELDKARGDKHPWALIDEAGSFRPYVLQGLVRDVIRPALADTAGGLWMIGTPNPTCSGPFFNACNDGDTPYRVYTWDMRVNPYLVEAEAEMASVRREYGWGAEDPTFRREWLGEWCYSKDAQVYAYDAAVNECELVPDTVDQFVIGLDLGYIDSTAVVVLGFHDKGEDGKLWVVEAYKEAKLIPTDLADLVRQYIDTYDPIAIVADTGGLGRSLVEELRQRYAMPIKAAEKTKKLAFIDLLNGDLKSGRLKVDAQNARGLADEWRLIQWDPDSRLPGRRWKISAACDDHLADAALYAWREAKHWCQRDNQDGRRIGPEDPGFEAALEDEMDAAFRRSAQGQALDPLRELEREPGRELPPTRTDPEDVAWGF